MKAIVIGATGLVGNLILKEILADPQFSEVRVFVRKTTGLKNPKLMEFISAMTDINELRSDIRGDVLFNALGTTIKQAGSKKEQQRVDRDLPVSFAQIASENGVGLMLNISSVGANVNGAFYLKTKAQLVQIRDQQKEIWNRFPPGWKKWDDLTMTFLKPIGDEIVRLLQPAGVDVVLDVASGTGEPGLTIASDQSGTCIPVQNIRFL